MPNKVGNADIRSAHNGVLLLHGSVTIGAVGAIASVEAEGLTVVRSGTGIYIVTLDDVYPELLNISLGWFSNGTPDDHYQVVDGSTPFAGDTIVYETRDRAGVLADPVVGSVTQIEVALRTQQDVGV